MITTPSKNAFISDEERRIKSLAYYGEFFANLDFDDGFRSIVVKQLLSYVENLETTEISCTQEETADMVRVVIEASGFETDTAKDIFNITTKLQADFCMTPILQSYPFKLDDEVILPVTVKTKLTDGVYFHRQIIQNAQADIIRLEKQLQSLHFRIDQLKKDSDTALVSMVEGWKMLIPQIEDKLENLKMEFQNLVAQKYIELASLETGDEGQKNHNISLFQADLNLDKPKTLYSKIGELEGKIDNITQALIDKTGDTSIEINNTQIRTGILRNIEQSKDGSLTQAIISNTKQQIYNDGEKIIGFKLEGIDEILDIKTKHISKNILYSFNVVLKDNLVQHFYLNESGEYRTLKIEDISIFKDVEANIQSGKRMSPLSGRIQNMNKTWSYFYKQDGEYRVLEIEGNRNFKKIEEHKSIGNKPISGKIKNMNEKREYFYTKNGEYKVFDLNGYKEFDDIYIYYKNTDINGKPIKGVAKLNGKRKSFDFNPSFIEKLFSKGTDVKRLS